MARKVRSDKGKIVINTDDIVGKAFFRLKVVEYAGHWCDKTLGGDRMRHAYVCECECGNTAIVRRQCLLNGMTKSCGCLKTGRPTK